MMNLTPRKDTHVGARFIASLKLRNSEGRDESRPYNFSIDCLVKQHREQATDNPSVAASSPRPLRERSRAARVRGCDVATEHPHPNPLPKGEGAGMQCVAMSALSP